MFRPSLAPVTAPPLSTVSGGARFKLVRTSDERSPEGMWLGYTVEEGKVSTDEWQSGNASGAITEVFACGTAAVITPVGAVKSATDEWTIGDGQPGPISMQLREHLTGVQTGQLPDSHGWMHALS